MKIEHVALYVRDLEGAKRFLKGILMQKLISFTIIRKQVFSLTSSALTKEQDWKS